MFLNKVKHKIIHVQIDMEATVSLFYFILALRVNLARM